MFRIARRSAAGWICQALVAGVGGVQPAAEPTPPRAPIHVHATVETEPVLHARDAADDACIWIHPTDPALSTIIGTDKQGGLTVYDLDGREIQRASDDRMNNIDLRYNFPLGGRSVALVVAGNRTRRGLSFFRVDAASRRLVSVGHESISMVPTGTCLYYSKTRDQYYGFVTTYDSTVEQWRLFDAGDGTVAAELARSFKVADISPEQADAAGFAGTEACVADDETGSLYIAEEDVALWEYGADPDADADADAEQRTAVHRIRPGGPLEPDIEGVALFYGPAGQGYILVSNQEQNEFVVFSREADHRLLGSFSIVELDTIDGVTHTDGIDVTNRALGPNFPFGMFVAQDDSNRPQHQNFKLVRWEEIARRFDPPLLEDTSWDPRTVGSEVVEVPAASGLPRWLRIVASVVFGLGIVWSADRVRRRIGRRRSNGPARAA